MQLRDDRRQRCKSCSYFFERLTDKRLDWAVNYSDCKRAGSLPPKERRAKELRHARRLWDKFMETRDAPNQDHRDAYDEPWRTSIGPQFDETFMHKCGLGTGLDIEYSDSEGEDEEEEEAKVRKAKARKEKADEQKAKEKKKAKSDKGKGQKGGKLRTVAPLKKVRKAGR